MELSDQSRLSFYHTIATLDENHGIDLVQHTVSKKIYVKKVLSVYDLRVFQYVKSHPFPHIPRIIELVTDGPLLIVIEEYITGRTIQEILDTEGCFSETAALHILEQVCVILSRLHSVSPPIIHRDIKPSNIIVSDYGTVTLLDINAAKLHNAGQYQDTQLIGTHGFAAPEQYGFAGSDVRTDVYSLGVLLNVMLMNALPQERTAGGFSGKLIAGCTRMEPEDRYASVDILLALIRKHLGIPSEPDQYEDPVLQSFLPPGFRSRSPVRMILAVLLYLLITAVFLCSELEGSNLLNWIYRILLLIPSYLIILFSGNYRNIWGKLRYFQHQSKLMQIVLITLVDLGIFFIGFLTIILIENAIQ